MRRIVALGCCALALTFSSLSGLAHVHDAASEHHESAGLHLDHAHPSRHHDHGAHEKSGTTRLGPLDVDHHDGEAVYLFQKELLAAAKNGVQLSVFPVASELEPPAGTTVAREPGSSRPRDPPARPHARLRAPPA